MSVPRPPSRISTWYGIRKFGIVQISAADRMDIGIKRKGVAPTERFDRGIVERHGHPSRAHHQPAQIDTKVLAWLKLAYDAA